MHTLITAFHNENRRYILRTLQLKSVGLSLVESRSRPRAKVLELKIQTNFCNLQTCFCNVNTFLRNLES